MTRKLMLTGLLALAGVMVTETAADAGLRSRRAARRGNDCNTCATPVASDCNTCNSCGGGYSASNNGGVPIAMPMPGGTTVIPASGTIPSDSERIVVPASGAIIGGTATVPSGTVVPAGGYIYRNGNVVPAGTYYDPTTRSYYTPGTGTTIGGQTFSEGVIQGAVGVPSMYSGSVPNYAGNRVGRGLFRRR